MVRAKENERNEESLSVGMYGERRRMREMRRARV